MADGNNNPPPVSPYLAALDRQIAEQADWRRLQPRVLPDVTSLSEYRVRTTAGRVLAAVYLWNEGGANPKPEAIIEAHRIMFERATTDAGRFRVPGEPITYGGGRDGADPRRVAIELQRLHAEMGELLGASRTQEDRCAAIAYYHARFIAIHPFMDGNGRIGRAIMEAQSNLLGMRFDLSKIAERRREYKTALDAADERNDIAPLMRVIAQATGTEVTHAGELVAANKIRPRTMQSLEDIKSLEDERSLARISDVLPLPSERGAKSQERTTLPGQQRTITAEDWKVALQRKETNTARQSIHEAIAKLALGGKLPAKHEGNTVEWAEKAELPAELRAALRSLHTERAEKARIEPPRDVEEFMGRVEAIRPGWGKPQAKGDLTKLVRSIGASDVTGVPLAIAAEDFLSGRVTAAAVRDRAERHLDAGQLARELGTLRNQSLQRGHTR